MENIEKNLLQTVSEGQKNNQGKGYVMGFSE
jgi:hypothetical protein